MVSCQKGPTRHAYAWQIGPFWQDTLELWGMCCECSVWHVSSLHGCCVTYHAGSWGRVVINTLRPRQNGRHFADDTFNRIFLNENVRISIKFSLKFVRKGPINNILALVQIMACRRPGDKSLSEPGMVSLLMHICVTGPQWV